MLKRKGNVEICETGCGSSRLQILMYTTNHYYGNENNYIKNGEWYELSSYRNCKVHEDCFKSPQIKYVVAFIENGVVEFVGNRALKLEYENLLNFTYMLRYGIKKSINLAKNSHEK